MENKRLFLGMEIAAPWPDEFPSGRILLPSDRHLTLAFLGEASIPHVSSLLTELPKASFSIGIAGYFDQPLFLPKQTPHVAAWHIHWLEFKEPLLVFQKELMHWAKQHRFALEKNQEFLSHVTIAREPFAMQAWKESFEPLPMFAQHLHLYESLGHSHYQIHWTHPMLAPFEEIEHIADIAFIVRGKTLDQVHLHAQLALSFRDPKLLRYFSLEPINDIDAIVRSLNAMIARADEQEGSALKAVSYHGECRPSQAGILEWEMIVDV